VLNYNTIHTSCILIRFWFSQQIGDFLILHFLSQNLSTRSYSDMLQQLCGLLGASRTPSAPSTLEMNRISHPIYPPVETFGGGKETET